MLKKAITRAITSFMGAVSINVIIGLLIILIVDKPDFLPVLPEYADRFPSDTIALLVEWLLIGLTSASFGFWSIIMESERISLVAQSILYFILTTIVWLPVSIFCWNTNKYIGSFIGVTLSYLVSYIISWTIQYRLCKESIRQINQKLDEMRVESERER